MALTDQEKASLAEGERIAQGEEAQVSDTYEKAREAEGAELQFAGKFRTAEDLEKAYLELQKKLGKPKEEEETPPAEEEEEPVAEEGTPPDAPQVAEEAPSEEPEVEESPSLSDEDAEAILEAVGGRQAYDAAIEWAGDNLSEAEQEGYNRILATADPYAIQLATEGLMSRFRANADFQGKLVNGRPGGGEGAKPYRSRAEVQAAMTDPRYDSDPAYRNDLMARLAVSDDDLL